MSSLSTLDPEVKARSVHACPDCHGSGCAECDHTGRVVRHDFVSIEPTRIYLACQGPEVIDAQGRLLDLVNALVESFPEAEDLAIWEVVVEDGESADCWTTPEQPPRLLGCIRPGPDGGPVVTWL